VEVDVLSDAQEDLEDDTIACDRKIRQRGRGASCHATGTHPRQSLSSDSSFRLVLSVGKRRKLGWGLEKGAGLAPAGAQKSPAGTGWCRADLSCGNQ
jgi:hypothetical protein